MAAKSFFEVLEQQIRTDLRQELKAEVEAELRQEMGAQKPAGATVAASSRLETWLASNLSKTIFGRTDAAKQAYRGQPAKTARKQTPRLQTPPSAELRLPVSTPEEIFAAELLRRHSGIALNPSHTRTELKLAWRRTALRTHPDRFSQDDSITQARANALFSEICAAYELLDQRFEILEAA